MLGDCSSVSESYSMIVKVYANKLCYYMRSIQVYDDSPILLPMYGPSEYPQAFSRLSAVFGSVCIVSNEYKITGISMNNQDLQRIQMTIRIILYIADKHVEAKKFIISKDYSNIINQFSIDAHQPPLLEITPQANCLKCLVILANVPLLAVQVNHLIRKEERI
jgi:RAB protein geranylgeranyltransferase component A